MITTLKEFVINGNLLTKEQALELAACPDKELLYEAAHEITIHFNGYKFDTCSIVNAKSGNCSEDCKWCAQSGHYHTQVKNYPLLPPGECISHAVHNRKQGIHRFGIVTSGKQVNNKELETITGAVRAIRATCDIKCCALMGLLSREQLQTLYASGVENYHCNIETAPSYFSHLCTTHTLEQRIEMAIFLQQEGILSIPINLLQPIPGTPLGSVAPLSDEEFLTAVALFRFINPKAYLRFSGGRAQLSKEVQQKALYIGMNSSITGDLLTTVGSTVAEDKVLFTGQGYSLQENTDWEQ